MAQIPQKRKAFEACVANAQSYTPIFKVRPSSTLPGSATRTPAPATPATPKPGLPGMPGARRSFTAKF